MISTVLIFGLTLAAATGNYCSCSRPPQDYLAIEAGSSRGAKAIDWLVARLGEAAFPRIQSNVTAEQAAPPAAPGWSGEMVARFLKRANLIAKRAASVPRNELPATDLDQTGVLAYEGDFFTLEFALKKLLNLIGSDAGDRICFSNSDTNEHLQLIYSAFGSISNFQQLMRSPPAKAIAEGNHPEILDYLRLYGAAHYADCLARVGDKFREAERQLDGEKLARLDKLVASTKYTMYKKPPLDERLASMARDLDLDKSKLVINKLASAVGPNQVPGFKLASETSHQTVTTFLSSVCQDIMRAHLDSLFTVFNLARLFVPEKASQVELRMPDRFMKLNEYQRLCNQYRSSQSRRDVANNLSENNDKGLFRRMFGFEAAGARVEMRNKPN